MNKSIMLVVLFAFLSGGSSMPSQSKERFEKFADDYSASIDPAGLRVKLFTDNDTPLLVENTRFTFTVELAKVTWRWKTIN